MASINPKIIKEEAAPNKKEIMSIPKDCPNQQCNTDSRELPMFQYFRPYFFYQGAAAFIVGAVKQHGFISPVLTFDRGKAKIFVDEDAAHACVDIIKNIPDHRYIFV